MKERESVCEKEKKIRESKKSLNQHSERSEVFKIPN